MAGNGRDVTGLTFKGIRRHHLIPIVHEQEMFKVDKLIEQLFLLTFELAVVYVNGSAQVGPLVKAMQDRSGGKLNILLTNGEKHDKNIIKEELSWFSKIPRVLITTDAFSGCIASEKVSLVFIYDMIPLFPEYYLRLLGRFANLDAAIYFVSRKREDWVVLVDMHELYRVNFELVWPADFSERVFKNLSKKKKVSKKFVGHEARKLWHCSCGQDSELSYLSQSYDLSCGCGRVLGATRFLKDTQAIEHIVYSCSGGEEWKLSALTTGIIDVIKRAKSVVFVNSFERVNFLYEKVQFSEEVKSGMFQVFTDYLKFQSYRGYCMLITQDNGVDGIEPPPNNVRLVINYDLPSTMVLYDRRISWCEREGSVVHFVENHDWWKVFYIPIRYKCFLSWFSKKMPYTFIGF